MASFQKRGKTWQYVISNKGKQIRKGGFRTKKEAQIAASEIETKLLSGEQLVFKDIIFGDYFELYMNTYKTNIEKVTRYHYLTTLKVIREYFPNTPIQKISKIDYQRFLNEYGKNKAKETILKVNTHIKSCVREAIDEGIIRRDFTRNVNVISGIENKLETPNYLNYQESIKLLKDIYFDQNKKLTDYLILLGLVSGLRFSELVGLTTDDFDFKENLLTINKTRGYTILKGKGFNKTKNIQSNRTIAIDKKTMKLFKELFDKNYQDNTLNDEKLVFHVPHSPYKTLANSTSNKALKRKLKKLGLNTISIHGLRHTHASICIYKGATINYVSERLGHADVRTTYSKYLHVLNEIRKQDDKKVTNTFVNIFSQNN